MILGRVPPGIRGELLVSDCCLMGLIMLWCRVCIIHDYSFLLLHSYEKRNEDEERQQGWGRYWIIGTSEGEGIEGDVWEVFKRKRKNFKGRF